MKYTVQTKVFRLSLFLTTLLLTIIAAAPGVKAQTDVTSPSDAIGIVNGTNDGDANSGPPPAGEEVPNAIDNTTSKYLNFLDLGSGFTVTPPSSTTIQALRVFTANDAAERDPASYLLEGSNDGGASFTTISQGPLNLPAGRNVGGQAITTPGLFSQAVTFSNSTAYTSYRLTFPTLRDATAAIAMQIGEVELLNITPTAASVFVGGRVLSPSGRGVKSAQISLVTQNGEIRTTLSNMFGYFSFQNVLTGETYVLNASHKKYQFDPQLLSVTNEITDLSIVGNQ